jgi:outer membrane protein
MMRRLSLLLIVVMGVCPKLSIAAETEITAPALSLAEAVTRTLVSSPGVEVQREQIAQAEYGEQIAAGAFDWALFSSVWSNRSADPLLNPLTTSRGPISVIRQDNTGVSVGVAKRFRNGIEIVPTATVVQSELNRDPLGVVSRSDVRLQISVPLLRGWGADAANVNELVAKSALVATRESSRHAVGERVALAASSYWSTLASAKNLAILRDSEQRSLSLAEQLEDMVRVGEIEAAIMQEARADLLRRRGDVVGAALSLAINWQRLAAAMGLTPEEMGESPEFGGEFPAVPTELKWDAAANHGFVSLALARRGDYRAVVQSQDVESIFLRKALDDLRPSVDLKVRAGYSGIADDASGLGLFNALGEHTAGPAGEVALEFAWPVGNRSAQAEVGRRRSFVRSRELSIADLSTGISAETRIASATLKAAVARFSVAEGTVTAFATVVANIRRKVSTGEASITNLVQNEDRFVQARLALIAASRNYAEALVEMRRVTGTLVEDGSGEFSLKLSNLVSLPPADF